MEVEVINIDEVISIDDDSIPDWETDDVIYQAKDGISEEDEQEDLAPCVGQTLLGYHLYILLVTGNINTFYTMRMVMF